MEQKPKISLTIDGKEVATTEGATILDAATQNGIHIPTLCHHPALSNWGGCRMCMVEVDGSPKLVASCVMPVRPGMEVVTTSERILESRRIVLEFLFAERNHNCMFCPQSGDCELQKLAYELKMDSLGMPFSFEPFPTDATSEHMVMDHNRCILCGRCVRACAELAGNFVLHFHHRGPKSLIGMDLHETREASTCVGCGLCLQFCPTGAIYNRHRAHYAVKGHSKDWKDVESVCPQCGLLCPTLSRVREDQVLRIDGKPSSGNDRPDRGQLCRRGRFEVLRESGKRLLHPMVRTSDGQWREESWGKALVLTSTALKGAKSVFGVASSSSSNEELFLFRELMTLGFGAEYVDTLDGDHFRCMHNALAGRANGIRESSWKAIPEADMILLLGGDARESRPMLGSLIQRTVMEKGAKAVIIGEGGRHTQPPVERFSPDPGRESFLILGLLKAALESGIQGPEPIRKRIVQSAGDKGVGSLLKESGFGEKDQGRFGEVVDSYVQSKNPLVIAGGTYSSVVSDMGWALDLALLKGTVRGDGLRAIILKPQGNSAGAWNLGVPSVQPRPRGVRWQAGLMFLNGEEGSTSGGALSDFGETDFLATFTPTFSDEIAAGASVLIPVPMWMETEGTYTSLDGAETSYRKRILHPPSGVRQSWETLLAIAELTGGDALPREWEEVVRRSGEGSREGRWA